MKFCSAFVGGLPEIIIQQCQAVLSCSTLCDPMGYSPARTSVHGDSNTGVGCHALLQGIFLTQGLNPGLPHCTWILLPSQPPRKPNVAINISNIQERKEREALPLTSLPPSPSSVALNTSPSNSVEIPVGEKNFKSCV